MFHLVWRICCLFLFLSSTVCDLINILHWAYFWKFQFALNILIIQIIYFSVLSLFTLKFLDHFFIPCFFFNFLYPKRNLAFSHEYQTSVFIYPQENKSKTVLLFKFSIKSWYFFEIEVFTRNSVFLTTVNWKLDIPIAERFHFLGQKMALKVLKTSSLLQNM